MADDKQKPKRYTPLSVTRIPSATEAFNCRLYDIDWTLCATNVDAFDELGAFIIAKHVLRRKARAAILDKFPVFKFWPMFIAFCFGIMTGLIGA